VTTYERVEVSRSMVESTPSELPSATIPDLTVPSPGDSMLATDLIGDVGPEASIIPTVSTSGIEHVTYPTI